MSPTELPDLTKVPVEDRDRVWFESYYQPGATQLTLRAVLMGGLLGGAMSICNIYTTLYVGWAFGVAITSCVLSYTIWNAFVGIGLAKTRMTMLETNCMQSTASAAGYSTGGTVAVAAGAMLLMTGDENRIGWLPLAGWVFFVAVIGVFLAIPMKRQMINRDQLPFPEGIAAATTLRSLYAEGEQALKQARALIDWLIVGGAVGLSRSFHIIPEQIAFGQKLNTARGPIGLGTMGITFEPSLLLLAAGLLVGMRVCLSMLVGAVIFFILLPMWLVGLPDWSTEGVTFWGHMQVSLAEDGSLAALKSGRWSLWPGTAVLLASGLTTFALNWRILVQAFAGARSGKPADKGLAEIEVPFSWMLIGLVPATVGLCAVCWFSMQIHPLLGLLAVALSAVLGLVACRSTGETSTTPMGAMGKITQLIYAVVAPGNTTVNLMTAGVTAGAASSSADLLTDLKSGYLLGANPRQQFLAQFAGVFFGTVAVIPAWHLMVPDRATLDAMPLPATRIWYAVAQALAHGIDTIPVSARYAIGVGLLIGMALPLLEHFFPKSRRFLPSSMGLGLAGVVTFANALGFFIGAVIAWRWTSRDEEAYDRKIVPVASGAIAGESLASASVAILNGLKVITL